MRDGFRVIDADRHCMDPSVLWEPFLEPRFRGRLIAAGDVQTADGVPFRRLHTTSPDRGFRNCSNAPEYRAVFSAAVQDGFGPVSNLADMDREGVDVAVHFPSYGLSMVWTNDIDEALGAAVCRAYNSWIADYCSFAPERLKAVALVPVYAPEAAIDEMRRVKALGLAGIMWRPNPIKGRTLLHPDYLPVYRAAEELGLPILIHEGSDTMLDQAGSDRVSAFSRHIPCHPMEQMLACLAFCADGLMEQFPALRVGFMEAGCGWAPYWLERMDEHWRHFYFGRTRRTGEPPSFYFRRQCFVSCEAGEELVASFIEHLGEDSLVTATDYPHPDAVDKFPDRTIGDLSGGAVLSPSSKQKVLWDNPARLYGIS